MLNTNKYDWVFFVAVRNALPDSSCRLSALHTEVFHGQGKHPKASGDRSKPPSFFEPIPAVSNEYREPLHITRSGAFVPHIFCPSSSSLVVSEQVYKKINHIGNIVGDEVVFDKLVDIRMPDIGDMYFYTQKHPYKDPHPMHEYDYLDNLPELHDAMGKFYEILCAIPRDIKPKFNDLASVPLAFGRYSQISQKTINNISKNLVYEYPAYYSGCFVFREDVFQMIAPYFDLDYFAIDLMPFDKLP